MEKSNYTEEQINLAKRVFLLYKAEKNLSLKTIYEKIGIPEEMRLTGEQIDEIMMELVWCIGKCKSPNLSEEQIRSIVERY